MCAIFFITFFSLGKKRKEIQISFGELLRTKDFSSQYLRTRIIGQSHESYRPSQGMGSHTGLRSRLIYLYGIVGNAS